MALSVGRRREDALTHSSTGLAVAHSNLERKGPQLELGFPSAICLTSSIPPETPAAPATGIDPEGSAHSDRGHRRERSGKRGLSKGYVA